MTVAVMGAGLLVGVALNYLLPDGLFMKLAAIVTFSVVWVWLMILLSQLAMRRRLGPAAAELAFPCRCGPGVSAAPSSSCVRGAGRVRGLRAARCMWPAGSRCCRRPISGCPRCVGTRAAHRGPDYDDDKEE